MAATISIMPSKDNTLYEYDPAEGDHSNGAGFHFFAGENGMGELRRGVLAFDISGIIPAGSTITAVSLTMSGIGQYTWSSTQMVADVQSWLDDPASNFGWLVLGNETTIATAKRFDTRESASPPMLTIQYRVVATPRPRPSPAPRPQ